MISPDAKLSQRIAACVDEAIGIANARIMGAQTACGKMGSEARNAFLKRARDKMKQATRMSLFGLLAALGITEKSKRLAWAAGHGVIVDSFAHLTEEQGQYLLEMLEGEGPPEVI